MRHVEAAPFCNARAAYGFDALQGELRICNKALSCVVLWPIILGSLPALQHTGVEYT